MTIAEPIEWTNITDEIHDDIERILNHFHQKRLVDKGPFPPVMVGYHRMGHRLVALSAPEIPHGIAGNPAADTLDGAQAIMLLALRLLDCHSVLYAFDANIGIAFVGGPKDIQDMMSNALIIIYAHPGDSFIRGYEYTADDFTDRDNPAASEPATSNNFQANAERILGMSSPPPEPHIMLGILKEKGYKVGVVHQPTWDALDDEMKDVVEFVAPKVKED